MSLLTCSPMNLSVDKTWPSSPYTLKRELMVQVVPDPLPFAESG